jgi:5,10-methylenetetrahydrofolate reductase
LNFKQKLEQNQFVLTLEVEPPKGAQTDDEIKALEPFRGIVDAYNATELQGSIMRMSSLGMCALLEREGFPAILQVTGRDKNRLALQSELLAAYALGIRNVLVLTGDHPSVGDHPEAKPVFDLDSVQIALTAHTLNQGHDLAGNQLEHKPDFFIGAAVNPFVVPGEPELLKLKKKLRAGARFFQSQPVFDPAQFQGFVEQAKAIEPKVKILAGIMFIKSAKMARYINEHVSGIHIPEPLIKRIEAASDKRAEAVRAALEIARQIKNNVAGFHLMPMGWDAQAEEFIRRLSP